jgi:signal transduction histidine kinase
VVYHDPHKSVIMSPIDPIRLADELHDGIVQELSATLLMLETYQRRLKLDPETAEIELERIKLQLRETVRQVRLVIRQLRSQ